MKIVLLFLLEIVMLLTFLIEFNGYSKTNPYNTYMFYNSVTEYKIESNHCNQIKNKE